MIKLSVNHFYPLELNQGIPRYWNDPIIRVMERSFVIPFLYPMFSNGAFQYEFYHNRIGF